MRENPRGVSMLLRQKRLVGLEVLVGVGADGHVARKIVRKHRLERGLRGRSTGKRRMPRLMQQQATVSNFMSRAMSSADVTARRSVSTSSDAPPADGADGVDHVTGGSA